MKITPILNLNYKSKDGTYPLYIRVNIGQKRVLVPVGAKIKPTDWDKSRMRVKFSHVNAATINDLIISKSTSLEKNGLKDGSVTDGDKDSFYWWFDEFLKHCEAKHGLYHLKKMKNVKSIMLKFRDFSVRQLDLNLVKQFETYLISEKYHVNYIADIMVRFKTIVNTIVKNGGIEYHKNPFLNYRIKQIKTEKERLTYEEIMKLQRVKLTGQPALARDMYIVSFYQGGVRFGDLCRLTKDNFKSRFSYTMHKSTVQKNMVINPVTEKIMKKYGYTFPLGIDWKEEERSINSKNTLYNKHLKTACKKAKVNLVSFHSTRHSLTDYAIKKRLTSKQVQGILGHKNLATTEVYMKSLYQEETDEALKSLFGE